MWAAEAKTKKRIAMDCPIEIGQTVTISLHSKKNYALWRGDGIYLIPKSFIDEKTIRVISQ